MQKNAEIGCLNQRTQISYFFPCSRKKLKQEQRAFSVFVTMLKDPTKMQLSLSNIDTLCNGNLGKIINKFISLDQANALFSKTEQRSLQSLIESLPQQSQRSGCYP